MDTQEDTTEHIHRRSKTIKHIKMSMKCAQTPEQWCDRILCQHIAERSKIVEYESRAMDFIHTQNTTKQWKKQIRTHTYTQTGSSRVIACSKSEMSSCLLSHQMLMCFRLWICRTQAHPRYVTICIESIEPELPAGTDGVVWRCSMHCMRWCVSAVSLNVESPSSSLPPPYHVITMIRHYFDRL